MRSVCTYICVQECILWAISCIEPTREAYIRPDGGEDYACFSERTEAYAR
jgi:hypothetical protein